MPLQRGRRRLWTRSYGHPCLWITQKRGAACGQLEEHPTTRAEGCFGQIRPGSPSGASHHPGRRRRPRYRAPASGTGRAVGHHQNCRHRYADARCRQPAWDIGTSARYIPLTVSTTPSRCRRPLRRANNARPRGARVPDKSGSPTHSPRVTHTRTSIYETPDAHNGLISPLCATPCFLIPSLVCGPEGDGRTTDAPRPPNPCRHRFRLCPRAPPLPRSRGAAVELRLPLVRRPVPCAPCA